MRFLEKVEQLQEKNKGMHRVAEDVQTGMKYCQKKWKDRNKKHVQFFSS